MSKRGSASTSAPPGPPVLVVDDDPRMRQTIGWALEDQGLRVQFAGDGQDAVERATACRPCLVVLDMALPVLDGLEVARALRAVHGPATPPIISVSAEHDARQIGSLAHLSKPFELDDLLAAVERGLRLAS